MQNLQFEVNDVVHSKVSLFQGDITKMNVDAIVNAASETLLVAVAIDRAIHEVAGSELSDECQELNGCEIGDCKATSDNKLPANCVFHTVHSRDKNKNKLKDCFENCLQKVCAYKVKSVAFYCTGSSIYHFYPRKNAEIGFTTLRLWLESNHSSVDCVIF